MSADFDAHARSYAEDVSGSVAFSGKDVEFFTRRKAHHLVDLARRHLGDPLALRVLDVGCGIGMTDALLASSFGQLHGIDVAADAVAQAAERNPTVSYATYDGGRLPYEDASFDLAFTVCVLHHVERADRAAFTGLLTGAGLEPVEGRYILFLPIDGAWTAAVERACRGIPLGAQHYVVAERV